MSEILLEIKDISLNQNSNFGGGYNKQDLNIELQNILLNYISEKFSKKEKFNIEEYRNIIKKFASEKNIDINFNLFN